MTTYLTGEWRVKNGQHRLFDLFFDLFVVTASLAKAFNSTAGKMVTYNIGDHADFECAQFDLEVRIPLVGPIELVLQGLRPNSIVLGFEKPNKSPVAGTATEAQGGNIRIVLNHLAGSFFIAFFENHAPWLMANVGTDRRQWPDIWNFGRTIRNAMAHGGRLHIANAQAPDVSWHRLTYGPAQNGREVIGTDLAFGDIVILMVEMSDCIDALGCPLQP